MERFEKWLIDNKAQINNAAYGLFEDSIKCMKFDIVRPAYLMAYQGMMRHLRDVIVFGERPATSFTEEAWNDIKKDLNLENSDVKWDDNTYDRIRQGAEKGSRKPTVLNMPNDARSKFPYWRELRNVCAHNKEFYFIKAHTLTLYAFIEQFLLRITVEGGVATLLGQFDDFYNPVITAPGGDELPLIERIPSMVTEAEIQSFIKDVVTIRSKYHVYHGTTFLLQCFDRLEESYKDQITKLIKSNDDILEHVLEHDPERVLTFVTTPEEVRKIWYRDSLYLVNGKKIVAHLIEAGRMTNEETKEYFVRLLHQMYKHDKVWNEESVVTMTFKQHGFFDLFLDHFFDRSFTAVTGNMSAICHSISFYSSMINQFDVDTDDKFVTKVTEVFQPGYPYTLRDWFKGHKMSDPDYAARITSKVASLQLNMPASIQNTPQLQDEEEGA